MAGELKSTLTTRLTGKLGKNFRDTIQLTADQNTNEVITLKVNANDTAANIDISAITSPGYIIIQHTSGDTCAVGKDVSGFQEFVRCSSGNKVAAFSKGTGVTYQAKCDTGETSTLHVDVFST